MSTALTSTIPPSVRPVRIVGMLRFLPGVQRRCRVDVSTMDTAGPPGGLHRPTITSGSTSPIPEPRPSDCLKGCDTPVSQKRGDKDTRTTHGQCGLSTRGVTDPDRGWAVARWSAQVATSSGAYRGKRTRCRSLLTGAGCGSRMTVRRIGNCGFRRGRPRPPEDDGRAPVVCRTTQSSADRRVADQSGMDRPGTSGRQCRKSGKSR